jgi:membrane protease YdiL (CAAX protease family)
MTTSFPTPSPIETAPVQRPSRWPFGSGRSISHALFLTLALAGTFVIGYGVVGPALGLERDRLHDGSAGALAAVAATGLLQLTLVIGLGLLAWGRLSLRELGWAVRSLARELWLGAAGAAILALCVTVVVLALGGNLRALGHDILHFTPSQRVQMLLIGVFAALVEETLFRGYWHATLKRRYGARSALVLGALVFTLYHAPFLPQLPALLAKFSFALVLGGLREHSGTLLAPAFAHFGLWQIMGFT